MRGTGIAVAIAGSAILHVALLAVLDALDHDDVVEPVLPRPRLTLEPAPAARVADDAPIEVVLLTAPPPRPADGASDVGPRASARSPEPTTTPATRGPAADAVGPRAGDEALAASVPEARGPRSEAPGAPGAPGTPGVLSMRGARPIAPGVDLWHVPLTVAPADPREPLDTPPAPSGQLHPDGGGTFRTVRPGFTGHVAEDGRISFTDTPSFGVHVNIPRPTRMARAAARGLERWFDDPGAALRAGEPDPDELPGVRATQQEDPEEGNPDAVIVPIITGGFDATDAIMRANGQDPYLAAKLRWMDETRAERLELGRAHRRDQLAHATQSMRRHLARLWRTPGLDDTARRAALFELWDDCAEAGGDGDARADAALADACTRTRAEVLGFIRTRLPAGSPAAYPPDELRALNARRKTSAPFAPY